jgi:hypothetical protein
MVRITRAAIGVAVAHIELAGIVSLAAWLLFARVVMITAKRAQIAQRVSAASVTADNVIDNNSALPTPRDHAPMAIHAQSQGS